MDKATEPRWKWWTDMVRVRMGLWTDGCGCRWDWWKSGQVTDKRWAPGPDRQKGVQMCIWLPDRLESKGGWVGRPIGRQTDVWMRAWSTNGWVDRVWMELVDGWGECQAWME